MKILNCDLSDKTEKRSR